MSNMDRHGMACMDDVGSYPGFFSPPRQLRETPISVVLGLTAEEATSLDMGFALERCGGEVTMRLSVSFFAVVLEHIEYSAFSSQGCHSSLRPPRLWVETCRKCSLLLLLPRLSQLLAPPPPEPSPPPEPAFISPLLPGGGQASADPAVRPGGPDESSALQGEAGSSEVPAAVATEAAAVAEGAANGRKRGRGDAPKAPPAIVSEVLPPTKETAATIANVGPESSKWEVWRSYGLLCAVRWRHAVLSLRRLLRLYYDNSRCLRCNI